VTQRARVVGYVRVSTLDQATSGAGLAAQRSAISAECERRDWELLTIHADAGVSGKDTHRLGLADALAQLASGAAGALVVAKLDRLSRSMPDLVALLDRGRRDHWQLVALDVGLDTTSPQGEFQAHLIAAVAQLERRLISERTREALAAKAAAGVRIGRPPTVPVNVVERVVRERDSGHPLQTIADGLNTDRVPTARGGARWERSTVYRLLNSRQSHEAREARRQ